MPFWYLISNEMVKHYIYVFARSVAIRCILGRGAGRGYVRSYDAHAKIDRNSLERIEPCHWHSVCESASVASDLSRSPQLPRPARSQPFIPPTELLSSPLLYLTLSVFASVCLCLSLPMSTCPTPCVPAPACTFGTAPTLPAPCCLAQVPTVAAPAVAWPFACARERA